MSTVYLAIDIGASSGRHIVSFVENGTVKTQEVYRFSNGAALKDGHLCWDREGLFHHVLEGLKAAKDQGFTPAFIGIDTWAVDFVLLDENDRPLGDMVAYRDSRTEGMDALLEKALPFSQHYAICGIAKQPFNTVYQLMAVLQEHPEYRKTAKDFLLVPEYLSFLLTGKKAHEWTNLSTTALCDAQTKTFSPQILKAAHLPPQLFEGKIVPPGHSLGSLLPHIQKLVGYDAAVLLPATHDTGSAYMAVPARDENAAFLSSGTWSLLGTELNTAITGQHALSAGFTNEGGYGNTVRFLKNIMGMWMLQCIHKETGAAFSFARMADMAASSSYPYAIQATDNRFLAPEHMLSEVKQALQDAGHPAPETLSDVLRAVTVGLALCYRDAICEMEEITGKHFTSLNIVGGGSQNTVLNQMTADLTGLPVFAGPTEGTALGNLAGQMIANGEFASLADFRHALKHSFPITTFFPKEEST